MPRAPGPLYVKEEPNEQGRFFVYDGGFTFWLTLDQIKRLVFVEHRDLRRWEDR